MADEAQLVEDAVAALNEISSAYRGEPLGTLARQLSHQLSPQMAFDTNIDERAREYEKVPKEFLKEVKKVAKQRGPSYQTPVFKCAGDYEKCMRSSSSKYLCLALLALCVLKHLIPMVPKGHDGQ
jgi:hypothetical protein